MLIHIFSYSLRYKYIYSLKYTYVRYICHDYTLLLLRLFDFAFSTIRDANLVYMCKSSCIFLCIWVQTKVFKNICFVYPFLLYLSAYQYFRCDRWWVKSDRRIAVLITLLTICARIFDYFVYYCVKWLMKYTYELNEIFYWLR